MLRGFYSAGTGMLVQRDRMEVVANNLINVDTTGYKSDVLLSSTFRDMILERYHDADAAAGSRRVGTLGTGTHIEEVHTSFLQGGIDDTGRSCDFALDGDGFFTVVTPQGERYTRDGSFSVSDGGYLITAEGYYVQGQMGRIYVGNDSFTTDDQGNIFIDGALADRFRLVFFADIAALRKEGSNLFSNSGTQMQLSQDTKVMQNALETSNVDSAEEITRMLAVSRAYQSNQKVLTMVDECLGKAVNEVGKVG